MEGWVSSCRSARPASKRGKTTMTTMQERRTETAEVPVEGPPTSHKAPRRSVTLLVVGLLALTVGFGSVLGGIVGIVYTWGQAVEQNVTTPSDAAIPDTPVRGPFTMKAQIDIINEHQLARTGGLYFSEMPRTVQATDADGNLVVDEADEAVMVPNTARDSWITATALTSALSLGIMAYMLGAFAIVTGFTLAACGFVFLYLRRSAVLIPRLR
jgi:hypothetical protein